MYKVNKPLESIFMTINDAFSIISVLGLPVIGFAFFLRAAGVVASGCFLSGEMTPACVSLCPAGNTLCKSGSIAVFGNVVYSGLLNDHLWHLGVPLFTRLVRAADPSVHTYLHLSVASGSVEPKQASGAESPAASNGLLLMAALLTCASRSRSRRTGCDSPALWMKDEGAPNTS